MGEVNPLMARPRTSDLIVKQRAMEMFMPKVIRYLGADYRERDRQEIGNQIISVLSSFRDGYEMARELENRHGWATERELVVVMDDVSDDLLTAHKEMVAQWVKCYGITPERKIGDAVTGVSGEQGHGIIVKIFEDQALYGVRYPNQKETIYYVLNYEDAKSVLEGELTTAASARELVRA